MNHKMGSGSLTNDEHYCVAVGWCGYFADYLAAGVRAAGEEGIVGSGCCRSDGSLCAVIRSRFGTIGDRRSSPSEECKSLVFSVGAYSIRKIGIRKCTGTAGRDRYNGLLCHNRQGKKEQKCYVQYLLSHQAHKSGTKVVFFFEIRK